MRDLTLGATGAGVVTTTPTTPAATTGTGPFAVQIGAFYSEESANALARQMSHVGNFQVVSDGGMHRVRALGLDAAGARSMIDTLRHSESMSPGLLRNGAWINADSI
ncbi:MAG: SPOR domain-containing protein [Alphaproteobacteria bacterium]|nr:SPOR domain-containing protein [Alphaproteobacteria bacterium]